MMFGCGQNMFNEFDIDVLTYHNKETEEAFAEIEEMKKHPEQYKGYTDIDELFQDLDK